METKLILHKAEDRGHSDHGWLQSNFSFSFADWYEPTRMGFGLLRVINDDVIAPSMGFGMHPHRDMEIVTIPMSGELEHKDTMGNHEVIHSGEVQRMSAGTGVLHSEYNHSDKHKVKLFQIWVETKKGGIEPSYEQKKFDEKERKNKFQLVVSPDGRKNSVSINQDVYFTLVDLDNKELEYKKYEKENGIYILNIEGRTIIEDQKLNKRDALGIENKDNIKIKTEKKSKVLLIEVPLSQK